MKKIALLLIIIVAIFNFIGCSPLYVIRGAWEEAKILTRRERIEGILAEKELGSIERSKLELVMAARKFAEKKGLNVGRSYSQYATVDSSALVWVLTAAPKFKLEPMVWWYPIVGSMPYKGFFSKADAFKLKEKLEARGYDVFVRSSSAFSTLGWFNDPVLSTMIQEDEVSLVDTVLHEILHRTIWIPGSVDFNESLANFVGGQLAKEFFIEQNDQEKVALAALRQKEEFEFSDFIVGVSAELEGLYSSNESKMAERKVEILEGGRIRWSQRGESGAKIYQLEKFPFNNASILGLRTYLRGLRDFDSMYRRCGDDFQKFIEELKSFKESDTEGLFRSVNLMEDQSG